MHKQVTITARPTDRREWWETFNTTKGVTMAARAIGAYMAALAEDDGTAIPLELEALADAWGVSMLTVTRGLASLIEGRWISAEGRNVYRLTVAERVEVTA